MCAEKVNAPTVDEVRELLYCCFGDGLVAVPKALVAALCNHFLASQQPMTAGEFAGLVVCDTRKRATGLMYFHPMAAASLNAQAERIVQIAAEHNITIAESKK